MATLSAALCCRYRRARLLPMSPFSSCLPDDYIPAGCGTPVSTEAGHQQTGDALGSGGIGAVSSGIAECVAFGRAQDGHHVVRREGRSSTLEREDPVFGET